MVAEILAASRGMGKSEIIVLSKDIMDSVKKETGKVRPGASLFLDVATKYTGFSLYVMGTVGRVAELSMYGIIKSGEEDWESRCFEITMKTSTLTHKVKPGLCVMEFPTFQAGVKGVFCSRSGGTIELAYLCGRLSVVWEFYITKVMRDTGVLFKPAFLLPFSKWNGQLTKEITAHRCQEHFGLLSNPKSIDNNWVDAVMMGKWFLENECKCAVSGECKDAERLDL